MLKQSKKYSGLFCVTGCYLFAFLGGCRDAAANYSERNIMQIPKIKIPNKLFSSFIRYAIVFKLLSYNGRIYELQGDCPNCGSSNIKKNHIHNKLFTIIITDEGFKRIYVNVRWFTCKDCGKTFRALDAPFYPNSNYADVIVDMVLYYGDHPAHAVEKKLMDLGIQIDRDTIRKYFSLFGKKINKKSNRDNYKDSNETINIDLLNILFLKKK